MLRLLRKMQKDSTSISRDNVPLNTSDKTAFKYLNVDEKEIKKAKQDDKDLDNKIMEFMCKTILMFAHSVR